MNKRPDINNLKISFVNNIKKGNLTKLMLSQNQLFYTLGISMNVSIKFQVDTGSSVTLVDYSYFKYFNIIKKLPQINLVSFTGNCIKSEGNYLCRIFVPCFGYINLEIIFAKNIQNLLGLNFIRKTSCSIIFENNKYFFYYPRRYISNHCKFKLTNRQYIPPNCKISKRIFLRLISTDVQVGEGSYLLESDNDLIEPSIVSLVSENNKNMIFSCYMVMKNYSNEKLFLPEEFRLQYIDPSITVEPLDLNSIHWIGSNSLSTHQVCSQLSNLPETIEPDQIDLDTIKKYKNIHEKEREILAGQMIDKLDIDNKIKSILKKHYSLWSIHSWDLGEAKNNFTYAFDKNFERNFKSYPVKVSDLDKLRSSLKVLETLGLITKNTAGFGSPVFFKAGKDKSRLLIDARSINKYIFDTTSAQMVSTNSLLSLVSNCTIFSVIDISKAFWNIKVSKEVRESGIQNILTPFGSYTVNCLISGSLASPYSLIDYIHKSLYMEPANHLRLTTSYGFYDDILHIPRFGVNVSWDDYLTELDMFLDNLQHTKFKFNLSKSKFAIRPAQDTFSLLGFKIDKGKILPNADRLKALLELQLPKSLKSHQALLGSLQFLRHLIPTYFNASIVTLGSYSSESKFEIDSRYQEAFDHIKKGLISAGVHIPGKNSVYLLLVDASVEYYGFTLLEVDLKSIDFPFHEFRLKAPKELYTTKKDDTTYSFYFQNSNLFLVLFNMYIIFIPNTILDFDSFCNTLIQNILDNINVYFGLLLLQNLTKLDVIESIQSLRQFAKYTIGDISAELETSILLSFSSLINRQLCFFIDNSKFFVGIETDNPCVFLKYDHKNNRLASAFTNDSLIMNRELVPKSEIIKFLAKKIEQNTSRLPIKPLYYFTKRFDFKSLGSYIYLKELKGILYSLLEVEKYFDMTKILLLTDSLPSYHLLKMNKQKNRRSFETVTEIISKYPRLQICHIKGKCNFSDIFSRPVVDEQNSHDSFEYFLPTFSDTGKLIHFDNFESYLLYKDRLLSKAESRCTAKVQKTKVEPFTKKLNLKLNDSFYETKLNPVYVGRAYTEEELKYAVDNGFRQQLSTYYDEENKLFIPKRIFPILVSYAHKTFSHHKGRKFIFDWITENFRIKNKQDLLLVVEDFIKACIECSLVKPNTIKYELGTTLRNQNPGKLVSFDIMFIENNPPSRANFFSNQILIFIDHYSKYITGYFLEKGTESEISRGFLNFFGANGIPESLLCDNQTSFVSKTPIKICHLYGIHYINSSAYRSQARGLIEKTISSIRTNIRNQMLKDCRLSSQLACSLAIHIYNHSLCNTTLSLSPSQTHHNLLDTQVPFLKNQGKHYNRATRKGINIAIKQCLNKINKKKLDFLKSKNKKRASINFAIGDYCVVRARYKNKNNPLYHPAVYRVKQVFSFQLLVCRVVDNVCSLIHCRDVKRISEMDKKFTSDLPVDKLGLFNSENRFLVDFTPDENRVLTRARSKKSDEVNLEPVESELLLDDDEDDFDKSVSFNI